MILFYSHNDPEYGFLSNWYPCIFHQDLYTFNCVEQYMMFKKAELFDDTLSKYEILDTTNPKIQKQLGREVNRFDENIWDREKYKIVYNGCLLKFTQDTHLKKLLLSTKNKTLAEASPTDKVWGIGLSKDNLLSQNENEWTGLNLLGKALMGVRSSLI